MKKRFLVWLLIASTAIGAMGCGSSKYDSAAYETAATSDAYYAKSAGSTYSNSVMMDEPAYEEAEYYGDEMVAYTDENYAAPVTSDSAAVQTTENAQTSNRKLIRDVTLNVETKEYDALIKNLTDEVNGSGGYIEYMDVHNSSYKSTKSARMANLTVRIPASKLDAFLGKIGAVSNITSRTESVRDVTLTYVDMQSHRDMLIAERDRLMEYLESAETIEEMMTIEDHLTNIRYQIDSMESQLRTFDNQVDYSTVIIGITEVIEYTPIVEEEESVWERISKGFSRSLRDVGYDIREFFVDLIIDLPYIIIGLVRLAIYILVIWIIWRIIISRSKRLREWLKKRKAERKEYKAEKKAAKAAKKAAKKDTSAPSAVATGEKEDIEAENDKEESKEE